MRTIVIRSPRGNITFEMGWQGPIHTAKDMIDFVARFFDYTSISSGSETGRLIDWNDTPLHPNHKLVEGGEFRLEVINWP